MKINALVKGMNSNGWIHEEGLVIINKVLDIDNENSLFSAYNIDNGKYGTVTSKEFIAIDEKKISGMLPLIDNESLQESLDNLKNFSVGSDEEEINEYIGCEFSDEMYEDYEDYEDDWFYDEDENPDNIIEIKLDELINLIDTGWDDSSLSRLLLDMKDKMDSKDEEF